jgi:hypothetical protein
VEDRAEKTFSLAQGTKRITLVGSRINDYYKEKLAKAYRVNIA